MYFIDPFLNYIYILTKIKISGTIQREILLKYFSIDISVNSKDLFKKIVFKMFKFFSLRLKISVSGN